MEFVPLTSENLHLVWEVSCRNLEFDRVPIEVFRHITLDDPDFDPGLTLVANVDGLPRAFMQVVSRAQDEAEAGIKLFAVDPEFRNRGIASDMLSRLGGALASRGAGHLSIGFTRPNYLTPGLDPRYTLAAAFLLKRGFVRRGDTFNMDVDLAASDWTTDELEDRLAGNGITCRRLARGEDERLCEWMASAGFSAGWQYQVMHAAHQEPSAVFVAENDDRFVAFASYDGVRPGWFGPMGTKSDLRGGGIGSLLFLKCLQSMRQVGYRVCEVNSVGPLHFYSRVANARVSRIFWQFSKDLPPLG